MRGELSSKQVALFLDRDGTLNVNTHYTHCLDDLYLCDKVVEFFRELHNIPRLKPIIVTNQSGVARDYYSKGECLMFESALAELIYDKAEYMLYAPQWYHSWSKDENDYMRKPNPGMLEKACKDHNLLPGYIIGDKDSDVGAGQQAGCRLSFKLNKRTTLLDCLEMIKHDLHTLY